MASRTRLADMSAIEWCGHYRKLVLDKTRETPETECWDWQGRLDRKSGHGKADVVIPGIGKTVRSAHRLAYMTMVHGSWDLPSELEVSHLCGTPSCVRLQHLVLESHEENKSRQVCHNLRLCQGHEPECIFVLPA